MSTVPKSIGQDCSTVSGLVRLDEIFIARFVEIQAAQHQDRGKLATILANIFARVMVNKINLRGFARSQRLNGSPKTQN